MLFSREIQIGYLLLYFRRKVRNQNCLLKFSMSVITSVQLLSEEVFCCCDIVQLLYIKFLLIFITIVC